MGRPTIENTKELTKEMLIDWGFSEVSKDGKWFIFKGEKIYLLPQKDGYMRYTFRDPISLSPVCIPMQRIVYAWYKGRVPATKDIDHKDNNRNNNHLNNLRAIEHTYNVARRHLKEDLCLATPKWYIYQMLDKIEYLKQEHYMLQEPEDIEVLTEFEMYLLKNLKNINNAVVDLWNFEY